MLKRVGLRYVIYVLLLINSIIDLFAICFMIEFNVNYIIEEALFGTSIPIIIFAILSIFQTRKIFLSFFNIKYFNFILMISFGHLIWFVVNLFTLPILKFIYVKLAIHCVYIILILADLIFCYCQHAIIKPKEIIGTGLVYLAIKLYFRSIFYFLVYKYFFTLLSYGVLIMASVLSYMIIYLFAKPIKCKCEIVIPTESIYRNSSLTQRIINTPGLIDAENFQPGDEN